MMGQEEPIRLSGPVDYLVFTKTTIKLECGDSNFEGTLVNAKDSYVYIIPDDQFTEDIRHGLNEGNTITIKAPYRSKRLFFDTTLHCFEPEERKLVLEYPLFGSLFEGRQFHRNLFCSYPESLQATLEVKTLDGSRKYTSNRLIDFSNSALSILLYYQRGKDLSNDISCTINIDSGKDKVFASNGTIVLIQEVQQASLNVSALKVVISLTPTTAHVDKNNITRIRRKSDRFATEEQSTFLQFNHPLQPDVLVSGFLSNISNSGFSMALNTDISLPPGLYINEASLQLSLRPRIDVTLFVTSIYQIKGNGKNEYRACFVFKSVTPLLLKELSKLIQKTTDERLVDASFSDIDRLWELFFETGFIYRDKRRLLQRNANNVFNTYSKLLSSEMPYYKKILYKENGIIKGHGMAIKVFDHAVLLQHLNALKSDSGSAAHAVIKGMTSYFLDKTANSHSNNHYVCTYFQPKNLFSSLIFGQTAKLIDDPAICWTRPFRYCVPEKTEILPHNTDITHREAQHPDLKDLEALLISQSEQDLMKLEDLYADSMTKMAISNAYQKAGLYRYRRVFVAQDQDGNSGYAVCTYASPGINLSELTNAVRLFFSSSSDHVNQALADGLAPVIIDSYIDTVSQDMVILADNGSVIPVGFREEKIYILWSYDLSMPQPFRDVSEHIFANFKQFIKKRRAELT